MQLIRPLLRTVRPEGGYYRHRAVQEQMAAQKAKCEEARVRHDQLAAMYRFRALMLSDERTAAADPIRVWVVETLA